MSDQSSAPPGMIAAGRTVRAGRSPGKGPNGRPLCRWCHQEVPAGRRSWCSDACVRDYLDRNKPAAAAFKRDKGVCALCGCDTQRLARVIGWAQRRLDITGGHWSIARDPQPTGLWHSRLNPHREASQVLIEMGFTRSIELWQADHIVPVVEGGHGTPDNIRTLCVPCHKRETRELARRRADARAGRQRLQLGEPA